MHHIGPITLFATRFLQVSKIVACLVSRGRHVLDRPWLRRRKCMGCLGCLESHRKGHGTSAEHSTRLHWELYDMTSQGGVFARLDFTNRLFRRECPILDNTNCRISYDLEVCGAFQYMFATDAGSQSLNKEISLGRCLLKLEDRPLSAQCGEEPASSL